MNEEGCSTCSFCELSLPLAAVGMCSSCQFDSRNQTCTCDLDNIVEVFQYSPKRTEPLKEIQHIFDMPELKVMKPSDTSGLAHKRCVKGVKVSCVAIVTALEKIHVHEQSHEPEHRARKCAQRRRVQFKLHVYTYLTTHYHR